VRIERCTSPATNVHRRKLSAGFDLFEQVVVVEDGETVRSTRRARYMQEVRVLPLFRRDFEELRPTVTLDFLESPDIHAVGLRETLPHHVGIRAAGLHVVAADGEPGKASVGRVKNRSRADWRSIATTLDLSRTCPEAASGPPDDKDDREGVQRRVVRVKSADRQVFGRPVEPAPQGRPRPR
jgi:hypothetical protein